MYLLLCALTVLLLFYINLSLYTIRWLINLYIACIVKLNISSSGYIFNMPCVHAKQKDVTDDDDNDKVKWKWQSSIIKSTFCVAMAAFATITSASVLQPMTYWIAWTYYIVFCLPIQCIVLCRTNKCIIFLLVCNRGKYDAPLFVSLVWALMLFLLL